MQNLMREDVLYVPRDYAERVISTYTGQNRKQLVDALDETLRKLKFYTNSDFSFKDVHNEELFQQNGKILVEMVQLLQPYRIVDSTDVQFLGDMFEQLLNQGFKQDEGQFFTPIPIARFMWRSLPLDEIVRGENDGVRYPRVIDYACGAGHFLTEGFEEITDAALPYDPTQEDSALDADWVRGRLVGVEKDYRLARVLRVALYMHNAGQGEIVFGDGLENYPDKGIDSRKDEGRFDILAANPPYSVSAFKAHLKLHNNELSVLDEITESGSEIETCFVERAAQLVRSGGYAAIILPSSILDKGTNSSFVAARDVLLRSFELVAIARFGSGTFAATGTNVAILFLRRFDEVPTREGSAQDFVDAVFEGRDLAGWRDEEILAAYLKRIGVSAEDYRGFVTEDRLWGDWKGAPHFGTYADTFSKSATLRNVRKARLFKRAAAEERQSKEDEAFYRYAHEEEGKRLRVFALVYGEQTLVVNSPTSTSEIAAFLGYKWSNRKGNEGIQKLDGGGRLYSDDPDDDGTDTISGIIRAWFDGDEADPSDLSQYYYYADTQGFIDFDGARFDETLRMPRTFYRQREFASGVDVRTLGSVAEYVTESVPRDEVDTATYVTTESMLKNRQGIRPYEGEVPATAGTAFAAGDTLVSNIRPYLQKVWLADHAGSCSKDVLVLRSRDAGEVLPEFLHLLLWQADFFDYDMSTFTGTGRPRGDKNQILNYRVPVPSIPEQRELVAEFDRLTKEIEGLEEQIAASKASVSARFEEMFGDSADNVMGYAEDHLGNLGTFKNGMNYHSMDSGYKVPCIGVSDFKDRSFIYGDAGLKVISLSSMPDNDCFVKDGDILFVRSNGNHKLVGRCVAVYPGPTNIVFSGFCIRFRLNSPSLRVPYLLALLKRPDIKSHLFGKGPNIKNLNQTVLEQLVVSIPPLALQQEFADFVEQADKQQSELQQKMDTLRAKRDALLDRFLA